MGQSNFIHLENCEIVKETDKALLIRYVGTEHWIPVSHISGADAYSAGDKGVTVSITEWIAEQKGIEVED